MPIATLPPSTTGTTTAALPSYDAAPHPPTYSSDPHPDEESVAFTPRLGTHESVPRGNYTKHWPQATLILTDQEEDIRLPTYGRGARIVGELGMTNTDRVVRVCLKLSGRMSVSAADAGSDMTHLINENVVLWKQESPPTANKSHTPERCPSLFPVFFQLPQTYELHGKHHRLPPTFEATFISMPALFVRCMYTLSVTITRTRSWNLGSWTTNKTYITLINYRPRTRPPRPIVMLDTVFASIKPVPEEWTQVVAKMSVRPKFEANPGCKPIDCHLFVPSILSYGLSDTIPFHLQLISSLVSLRELLPPSSCLLEPSTNNASSSSPTASPLSQSLSSPLSSPQTPKANPPADGPYQPPGNNPNTIPGTRINAHAIRVSIARQVVVEIGDRRRFRTFTIGAGWMWPVPPQHGHVWHCDGDSGKRMSVEDLHVHGVNADDSQEDVSVDWQGEVKCWPEVTAGGFSASGLYVKDFLVLAMTPPNARSSFLVPLQLSHPIRLVTDSWVDSDALHPHDR